MIPRSIRWLLRALTVSVFVTVLVFIVLPSKRTSLPVRSVIPLMRAAHTASAPRRLRIPALQVDAPVIGVGLTADGAMETPKKADEVGWFALGVSPGEAGNAVITGHLDTPITSQAVFADLRRARIGDRIDVETASGNIITFHVTAVESYPVDAVPMQRIFGGSSGSHLHLITCDGEWLREKRTYGRRLVVYGEKIARLQDFKIAK